MGYGANLEVVIDIKEVRKIAPNEFAELGNILSEYDITIDDLATSIIFSDNIEGLEEEAETAVNEAYDKLTYAFKDDTGIELYLGYHNSEEQGSRYDEVDGAYFALQWGDVYELTPQAKALTARGVAFDMKTWVSFG